MRILVMLAVLLCCSMALAGPGSAAPLTRGDSQATAQALTPPAQPHYDPYLGQGDLTTKAIPVAGCYLWNFACEGAPAGINCNPNNPYCKCDGMGSCINVPPGVRSAQP